MAIDFSFADIGIGGGAKEASTIPTEKPEIKEPTPMVGIAPDKVHYKDEVILCGDCVHFISPNSCELVSGGISVDGTCVLAERGPEDELAEDDSEELAEGGERDEGVGGSPAVPA